MRGLRELKGLKGLRGLRGIFGIIRGCGFGGIRYFCSKYPFDYETFIN